MGNVNFISGIAGLVYPVILLVIVVFLVRRFRKIQYTKFKVKDKYKHESLNYCHYLKGDMYVKGKLKEKNVSVEVDKMRYDNVVIGDEFDMQKMYVGGRLIYVFDEDCVDFS